MHGRSFSQLELEHGTLSVHKLGQDWSMLRLVVCTLLVQVVCTLLGLVVCMLLGLVVCTLLGLVVCTMLGLVDEPQWRSHG